MGALYTGPSFKLERVKHKTGIQAILSQVATEIRTQIEASNKKINKEMPNSS